MAESPHERAEKLDEEEELELDYSDMIARSKLELPPVGPTPVEVAMVAAPLRALLADAGSSAPEVPSESDCQRWDQMAINSARALIAEAARQMEADDGG